MSDTKKKRPIPKKTATKSSSAAKGSKENNKKKPSLMGGLMPYILGLVALFFAACLFFPGFTGVVGEGVNEWLKGWFSFSAYLVPPVLMLRAVCFKKERREKLLVYKWIFSLLCLLLVGVTYSVFFVSPASYDFNSFYANGVRLMGGGSICGWLSFWMCAGIGKVATGIISVLLTLLLGACIFGKSPVELLDGISAFFAAKVTDMREDAKDKRLARAEERERMRQLREEEAEQARLAEEEENKQKPQTQTEEIPVPAPASKRKPPLFLEEDSPKVAKGGLLIDRETGEVSDASDEGELPGFDSDEILLPKKPKSKLFHRDTEEKNPTAKETLLDVFGAPAKEEDDLPPWEDPVLPPVEESAPPAPSDEEEAEEEIASLLTAPTAEDPFVLEQAPLSPPLPFVPEEEATPKEDDYVFPPISLLKYEPVKKAGSFEEQERTAEKLVEALASFGVRTRVLDIAVGPTVTRYELQPDTGVRVRSIVNLADDIALKLAASGVRIEAPIPGKEAVGIEVPNKSVATVYLRELIESAAFADAESKLTVCLGMDVAGKPIYCNITKMPHLLIAGATNMGKSVCMNSVITSILYKATPDEVKMILIDPKKVEMSIYNGIPHLIVPVVSEPKKAAGALAWAVSEMERRFALIEEVGVRNIANYNKTVASDPERKKEPYIVIIIDELADLMMTARDDVESSICRLAQKARAAGIHLIIGTQRPSVDVITGLIKANFPSRIAFTVSSQVDSRTIIDIAGAEKLMGRGDMLYAPVGSTKPTRVQGSFVSENEVEAITDHLREHKLAQYSQEIQEQIEKEAARCGEKKHSAGFDSDPDNMGGEAGENDPMLPQAIKIAIETGKISTSFIQRKLQLGYSRAGRITDAMGNMGVIGPFNGSKPREVLWTMNQYMEWMASKDNKPGNFEL